MIDQLSRRDLTAGMLMMAQSSRRKIAIVGAGAFGSWTAYFLQKAGHSVTLIDQYGPANSRASSGGESRIIRARYGKDLMYSKLAVRAFELWKAFIASTGKRHLFHEIGALWMARASDERLKDHQRVLSSLGVKLEALDYQDLRRRYPQIQVDRDVAAVLEPGAGALMARQAVQAVVAEFVRLGGTYTQGQIAAPAKAGIVTSDGTRVQADQYLFACGPWLQKLMPELLGKKIYPTRQVVFFYGPPAGDKRFAPPAMPVWGDAFSPVPWYGIPDLESRGFKVAFGWLGEDFDPDQGVRQPTADEIARTRAYVKERFPALADAPLVETRVCQYENTSNTDFVLDRHPGFENVWLAGGGSGHGFKHSPAVGEYLAARLSGAATPAVEPRFGLAGKADELPARTRQRP